MSAGDRLLLADATRVAAAIVDELRPGCTRIEVAGSIRRCKPTIGDIEIVAAPRFATERADLLGGTRQVSTLDPILARLAAEGRLVAHPSKPLANGDRYKRLWAPKPGVQVDLFLVVEPAQWGAIFAIRTGPAEFSEACVTRLHRFGLRCEKGAVREPTGTIVPTEEEEDFFALCRVPTLTPSERDARKVPR